MDAGRCNLARGRNPLYSPYLFSGFMRCGTCGGAVCTVSGGQGSPRYGCSNASRNGLTACTNRLTVRAKVVDPMLLAGLQAELSRPHLVTAIAAAVSREVRRAFDTHPHLQATLQKQHAAVARKLDSLMAALEDGAPLGSLKSRILAREAELQRIDDELAGGFAGKSPVDLTVIPTWISQQLQDLSTLLQDAPQLAKAEFKRLNVQFTLTPVRTEGWSFLRAEGTGDLSPLCRVTDLPHSTGGRPPSLRPQAALEDLPTRRRSPR